MMMAATSANSNNSYCIFQRRGAEDAENRREKSNRLCGAPRQNAWRAGAIAVYPARLPAGRLRVENHKKPKHDAFFWR
ncbi:MAG: hypothetical protein HW389_2429 [Bacteroidetes bacterium]|nr:hypothetical protein [Bacteroidota bacterium]